MLVELVLLVEAGRHDLVLLARPRRLALLGRRLVAHPRRQRRPVLARVQPDQPELLADLALVQPDEPELQPDQPELQPDVAELQPDVAELLTHLAFVLSHEPQLLAHLTILQPHQPSVLAHEPAVQPGQPELLAHVALVQPHPRMTGKQQQIGSARVLTTSSQWLLLDPPSGSTAR